MEVKGPLTVWLLKYLLVCSAEERHKQMMAKCSFLSENPLMLLKFGFLYAKYIFLFWGETCFWQAS